MRRLNRDPAVGRRHAMATQRTYFRQAADAQLREALRLLGESDYSGSRDAAREAADALHLLDGQATEAVTNCLMRCLAGEDSPPEVPPVVLGPGGDFTREWPAPMKMLRHKAVEDLIVEQFPEGGGK